MACSLFCPSLDRGRDRRKSLSARRPDLAHHLQVRSVFRIAEFAQGYDGELRTVEGWFYGLDALPLWLAIAVFAVIWPPTFLPEDHRPFAGTSAGGAYDMQRLRTDSPTEGGGFYRGESKA